MSRYLRLLSVLVIAVTVLWGCASEEATAPIVGSASPAVDEVQPEASRGPKCINTLSAAVIGTGGYGAIANQTQLDDELLYESVGGGVSICRIYVKWESGGTTYKWDDSRAGGYGGCTMYPHDPLLPTDASYMGDSTGRVVAALSDPIGYHTRCWKFQNPINGETVYVVEFDDPTDPTAPVRRSVTITVTP